MWMFISSYENVLVKKILQNEDSRVKSDYKVCFNSRNFQGIYRFFRFFFSLGFVVSLPQSLSSTIYFLLGKCYLLFPLSHPFVPKSLFDSGEVIIPMDKDFFILEQKILLTIVFYHEVLGNDEVVKYKIVIIVKKANRNYVLN